MAQPVRVRRLIEQEGQKLQRIVRRGSTSTVRFRRAMMLLASAGGTSVPMIARLMRADEDTVRDVIHKFNEIGLACPDPRWAGGRPRLLSDDDEEFVIRTATTRPTKLGKPFTRWSIRKLADHLRRNIARPIRIGREALRCLLVRRGVTFQRTKTWKESTDPDFDAKLDRIEYAINERPDLTFAFDEFGPLGIRPTAGSCWARKGRPDRLPATFHRPPRDHLLPRLLLGRRRHPVGCQPAPPQGHGHTLAALKSIRATRPDGAPIYVILDNLSAHTGAKIRRWAAKSQVELCFTPTNASWANPIEAHFGPLRQFTLANSNHPNHTAQTRELHRYLRWRNQNARHPDVLAAQRRERARVRSEKGVRRGGRPAVAVV
ncbi:MULTISPECIES: IS630 family transposase [unclassified Streptomyces]|uniref:IS630 family transposase n=1 Tax=unclassified Streptomyces TaxID=2593676 RepID=UPI0035E01C61